MVLCALLQVVIPELLLELFHSIYVSDFTGYHFDLVFSLLQAVLKFHLHQVDLICEPLFGESWSIQSILVAQVDPFLCLLLGGIL